MRYLLPLFLVLAWVQGAQGAVRGEKIEYRQGDTVLEGYLAFDDAVQGKRPGVLVAHAWKGLDDHSRKSADALARLGYTAFALDVYGKDVRPKTNPEASALAGKFKSDRALMRARALAGLEVLRAQPTVDPARVAAIGYCFGGTTVLELARAGAPLQGVVSFHGGLDRGKGEGTPTIKARVLALHGGDDPFVPEKDVLAFQEEMRKAKADWQLNVYGGAVHAFTDPGAGTNPAAGAAYDEKAARRSWEAMRLFFNELFKQG